MRGTADLTTASDAWTRLVSRFLVDALRSVVAGTQTPSHHVAGSSVPPTMTVTPPV